MYRFNYGRPCDCYCSGPASYWPASRDEVKEELEDYKASLESEIAILQKRIEALKGKQE